MEKILTNIIMEARKQKKFSYEDVEERSGVRVAVMQAIESGTRKKPRVNTLYQLSNVLDLDFVELLKICGHISTEKKLTLGKVIWNARLSKNLTREELAEKCYMCGEGIAFIERDEVRPRIATLEILAGELALDLEALLSFLDNALLGQEVKEARLIANFSVNELAEKSGVAFKTVKRLEEGKVRPHLETLEKITQVLSSLDLQSLKEKYHYISG